MAFGFSLMLFLYLAIFGYNQSRIDDRTTTTDVYNLSYISVESLCFYEELLVEHLIYLWLKNILCFGLFHCIFIEALQVKNMI